MTTLADTTGTAPPFPLKGHVALLVCGDLAPGALARVLARYASDDQGKQVHVIEYRRKSAPVRLANSFWAGYVLASVARTRSFAHIVMVGGCCAHSRPQQVGYAIRALRGHLPTGGGVTITSETADSGHATGASAQAAGLHGFRLFRRLPTSRRT